VLISGALLHFLTLGIPGLPYPQLGEISSLVGWKDLASRIESIENRLEGVMGVEPFVVGMDKNKIASELTFYRYKQSLTEKGSYDHEGLDATTGRQLFGDESLMYKYWFRESQGKDLARKGHPLILVSREMHEFNRDLIRASGWDLGEIEELIVKKNGIPVGRYYYAIATSNQRSGRK
jgi:dolichol-phosphate mannosyltransferase